MDISNWQIFSSLLTAVSVVIAAVGVSIALWQGRQTQRYTNQLMAADQRKQASLIRVSVKAPEALAYVHGLDAPYWIDPDPTVTNASEGVITDLWMHLSIDY